MGVDEDEDGDEVDEVEGAPRDPMIQNNKITQITLKTGKIDFNLLLIVTNFFTDPAFDPDCLDVTVDNGFELNK